jgi:hypothetical protein
MREAEPILRANSGDDDPVGGNLEVSKFIAAGWDIQQEQGEPHAARSN